MRQTSFQTLDYITFRSQLMNLNSQAAFVKFLEWSHLPKGIFRLTTFGKPKLIVLNYHQVTRKTINLHVDFLSSSYKFIDLTEFDILFHGKKQLRESSILLTFDDGYRSFFTDVYPVLYERNIPAVVFLPTSLVDTSNILWPDLLRVSILESDLTEITIAGSKHRLNGTSNRYRVYKSFSNRLKTLHEDQRKPIVEEFSEIAQANKEKKIKYYILTWDQIRKMADSNIEFGSHSHTHPILSTLSYYQLRVELEKSKKIIEENIKKEVICFAYPNGKKQDYDNRCIKLLSDLGYKFSFTTIQGNVRLGDIPYEIRRVLLFDKDHVSRLTVKLFLKTQD